MPKGGRGRPKKTIPDAGHKPHIPSTTKSDGGESSSSGVKGTLTAERAESKLENLEKQGEDSAAEEPKSEKSEEAADLVEEQKSKTVQGAKNKEENELVKPKGMKLNFVAPTIKNGIPIACLEKSEIEKEAIKWKRAIILYVIGDPPTISYMSYFLENQCHISNKPEIFFHNEGYFVVRCATTEDKEKLLYEGPHTMANRPVIVKEWVMDFSFEKEILKGNTSVDSAA